MKKFAAAILWILLAFCLIEAIASLGNLNVVGLITALVLCAIAYGLHRAILRLNVRVLSPVIPDVRKMPLLAYILLVVSVALYALTFVIPFALSPGVTVNGGMGPVNVGVTILSFIGVPFGDVSPFAIGIFPNLFILAGFIYMAFGKARTAFKLSVVAVLCGLFLLVTPSNGIILQAGAYVWELSFVLLAIASWYALRSETSRTI